MVGRGGELVQSRASSRHDPCHEAFQVIVGHIHSTAVYKIPTAALGGIATVAVFATAIV